MKYWFRYCSKHNLNSKHWCLRLQSYLHFLYLLVKFKPNQMTDWKLASKSQFRHTGAPSQTRATQVKRQFCLHRCILIHNQSKHRLMLLGNLKIILGEMEERKQPCAAKHRRWHCVYHCRENKSEANTHLSNKKHVLLNQSYLRSWEEKWACGWITGPKALYNTRVTAMGLKHDHLSSKAPAGGLDRW